MLKLWSAVEPGLTSFHVPAETLTRLRDCVRRLPLLSGAILEYHSADRIDFAIRALVDDGGRDTFASRPPTSEAWNRTAHLMRQWQDESSHFSRIVDTVYLEFDLPQGAEALPDPLFFFNEFIQDSTTLFAILSEYTSPQTAQILRGCIDALPPSGSMHYTGLLFARANAPLRQIFRLPAVDVIPYLRQIGWIGYRGDDLQSISALLARWPDELVVLELNIGDCLLPTLGIEIRAEGHWADLLGDIYPQETVQGMLDWDESPSMPGIQGVVKRINHVKFSWKAQGQTVKTYLFFGSA